MRYYTLKKLAIVLTLATLIVVTLLALGLLHTGAVVY